MAILPSITNESKRQLTKKQQSFLDHLVETQGDAKKENTQKTPSNSSIKKVRNPSIVIALTQQSGLCISAWSLIFGRLEVLQMC